MVADTESDSTQAHRAVWVGHGDKDSAETAIGPRDVGLDAAAESGAVAAFP